MLKTTGALAWVLQIALAVAMIGAGAAKLFGDPPMVEMFATIGIGQWFRYVVGVLEVAGGVGLLIPWVRALAALGLLLLLLAAAGTSAAILGESPAVALTFGAMSLAILLLRRRELDWARNSADPAVV